MKQEIIKFKSTNYYRNKKRNELVRKRLKIKYQKRAGTYLLDPMNKKEDKNTLEFNIDSDYIMM